MRELRVDLGIFEVSQEDYERVLGWACSHSNHCEPDDEGYAICFTCGALVTTRITLRMLNEAYRRIREDR